MWKNNLEVFYTIYMSGLTTGSAKQGSILTGMIAEAREIRESQAAAPLLHNAFVTAAVCILLILTNLLILPTQSYIGKNNLLNIW